MARDWEEVPIGGELFENLPETMLSKSLGAMENVFVTEGKTHSRFPGLKHWGLNGAPVDLKDVVGSIDQIIDEDQGFFAENGLTELTYDQIDSTQQPGCVTARGIAYSPELELWVTCHFSDGGGMPSVFVSKTGKRWAGISTPALDEATWDEVIWAPSGGQRQFVLIGSGNDAGDVGTFSARSSDGLNWIFDSDLSDQCYAGVWAEGLGLYVAGGTGSQIWTSPDAIAWTSHDISGTSMGSRVQGITWSASRAQLIAVGTSGGIITSSNATAWADATSPPAGMSSHSFSSVLWIEELLLYVTIGTGSGHDIATSPDGDVWTQRTSDATYTSGKGLAWASDIPLVVGGFFQGAGADSVMQVSANAIAWSTTARIAGLLDFVNDVEYSIERGRFVSGGTDEDGAAMMVWSDDGLVYFVATPEAP